MRRPAASASGAVATRSRHGVAVDVDHRGRRRGRGRRAAATCSASVSTTTQSVWRMSRAELLAPAGLVDADEHRAGAGGAEQREQVLGPVAEQHADVERPGRRAQRRERRRPPGALGDHGPPRPASGRRRRVPWCRRGRGGPAARRACRGRRRARHAARAVSVGKPDRMTGPADGRPGGPRGSGRRRRSAARAVAGLDPVGGLQHGDEPLLLGEEVATVARGPAAARPRCSRPSRYRSTMSGWT